MLKLLLEKVTFGTARSSSEPPSIFLSSSAWAEKAETAIGTLRIDSSRFWAVTMISAGPSSCVAPGASLVPETWTGRAAGAGVLEVGVAAPATGSAT